MSFDIIGFCFVLKKSSSQHKTFTQPWPKTLDNISSQQNLPSFLPFFKKGAILWIEQSWAPCLCCGLTHHKPRQQRRVISSGREELNHSCDFWTIGLTAVQKYYPVCGEQKTPASLWTSHRAEYEGLQCLLSKKAALKEGQMCWMEEKVEGRCWRTIKRNMQRNTCWITLTRLVWTNYPTFLWGLTGTQPITWAEKRVGYSSWKVFLWRREVCGGGGRQTTQVKSWLYSYSPGYKAYWVSRWKKGRTSLKHLLPDQFTSSVRCFILDVTLSAWFGPRVFLFSTPVHGCSKDWGE